ncbi:DNA-binding transcriptional MerR regulator [Streptomyces sp. V4I8]
MMGVLMARRGRKRRLDVEAEYWRLLQSGVGTVEACRRLGIGRKTGYRWRSENGGLPPERVSETVHSGRYLSLLERKRIATLRERGLGIREIAERLERSPSTVSRELRRNMLEHDKGVYDADLAHHRSRQRAERLRRPKSGSTPSSAPRSRPSSTWSGAPNRSPPTCVPCGRTGPSGTCATRASTGPSTRAPKVS